MADDAGALLVRSGLVSASSLDEARARVESLGGTLGEQLVTGGAVGDDALTEFYKSRLLVPQVNPNTLARLPTKVIATIPQDMAIELRVIPVSIDKDNNLTVAMSDPSDRHAVDEIGFFTGAYVVRAVATQMQIAWCLAHYYGHVTALGQKLLQPNAAQPAVTAAAQAAVRARVRGQTGQVAAMRHRAIAPETSRPSEELDEVTARDRMIGPVAEPAGRMQSDADPASDALPEEQPRARSISGEIRLPSRRASSIKPPLPEGDDPDIGDDTDAAIVTSVPPDLSEPTISIEAGEPDGDPTGPSRPAPARKRKAKTDPPELAARAGEIGLKTGPIRTVTAEESIVIADEVLTAPPRTKSVELLPDVSGEMRVADPRDQAVTSGITIEVKPDLSEPVVIIEQLGGESQPIMLDRKRDASDAPTNVASPLVIVDDDDDDVVVLNAKKPGPTTRRPERRTQVGVGANTAATRAKPDGEISGGIPSDIDDQPTGARTARVDNDPTRVDTMAAPLPDDYTPSDGSIAAPPIAAGDDDDDDEIAPAPVAGAPLPSGQIRLDGVVERRPSATDDDDDDDDRGHETSVMSAVELDDMIPERKAEVVPEHLAQRRIDYDSVDDGWGPPGSTIPPPLLGAIPGSADPDSGIIPLPNLESAPLMVAPPVPPEAQRGTPAFDPPPQGLSRALDDAIQRVLDLVRTLDQAHDRDEVVRLMIAHLAESHRRAGFFAARAGELSLFASSPRIASTTATLRLDRPSTLQDVVGTRLPYRGPVDDAASRTFLTAVLGAVPPEILLVPISIRERVVGVLFGEQRLRHTFDDQLSLAARAAGMALERILKAKRN
ncbi:MAG: ral secretory system protein domain protein [Myxococcales bacterium]|nr:ral secretory system protein domain protein [Myxococcales bacterium]